MDERKPRKLQIPTKEEELSYMEPKLRELCKKDKSWNKYYEEDRHHAEEHNRLLEECNKIERSSQQSERSKEIDILNIRRKLENSKEGFAVNRRSQRQCELKKRLAKSREEHIAVEVEIKQYQGIVHFWENEISQYVQELNQLESERDEKKKSKQLLDEAMKDGSVDVIILVCILLGQAGVGKTSLKYLLLDQRPPDLRSSTICAETPVRIELRPVTEAMFQSLGDKWKEVKDQGAIDLVARMILVAELDDCQIFAETDAHGADANSTEESEVEAKTTRKSKGILKKITRWLKRYKKEESDSAVSDSGSRLVDSNSTVGDSSSAERDGSSASAQVSVSATSDACQRAMNKIMDELVQRIRKLKFECEEGQSLSLANLGEEHLKFMWVYLSDCGGQPEYHELLPLFVRRISSALCVTRLTDKLDETQPAEYFDRGQPVGEPRQCQLSTKDTIQCLVNTTQSYSTQDQPPRIIMVGTHLDKLEEMLSPVETTVSNESQALPCERTSLEAFTQQSLSPMAYEGKAKLEELSFIRPAESVTANVLECQLPLDVVTSHEVTTDSDESTQDKTAERSKRESKEPSVSDSLPLLSSEVTAQVGDKLVDRDAAIHQPSLQIATSNDTGPNEHIPAHPAGRKQVETLEEKNKQLLEMLEPEFSEQLVYAADDLKKLLFAVNTLNPGDRERTIAREIRRAVENSGIRQEKIPIWWYVMEQLLQQLAKELGRGVLSRAECIQMAHLLNICEESFEAALVYFDELNVIKYNPKVLPNVIFVNSQIPLDKLSELILHCYRMKQAAGAAKISLKPLTQGSSWTHFRDHGVVTEEILDHFPRHYVPGIFERGHLSTLLSSLLILAEIPPPDWVQDPSMTKQKYYIMPSLLPTLSEAELERYRICSPAASTLLVRFPSHSRRAGVFCCFVIHLIRHGGWKLLIDSSYSEPIFRNCAKLELFTSPPCTITVIDANSNIEVHACITAPVPRSKYACHFPVIRQAILNGIKAACIALNYNTTNPELAIYCPHISDDQDVHNKRHTATLTRDRKYWRCDLHSVPPQSGLLDDHHSIWFEGSAEDASDGSISHQSAAPVSRSNSIVIALPTELVNSPSKLDERQFSRVLNLTWNARSQWFNIGLQLSIEIGDLEAIRKNHQDCGECLREMLLIWIRMTDPDPTWETLTDALKAPSVGIQVELTGSGFSY